MVRAATVAMQRCGNHASTTIEDLCFLRGPCRGFILRTFGATRSGRCGGGFNASDVALRVVGDDEKGTQCLGV
jgi:hypothetical protein